MNINDRDFHQGSQHGNIHLSADGSSLHSKSYQVRYSTSRERHDRVRTKAGRSPLDVDNPCYKKDGKVILIKKEYL